MDVKKSDGETYAGGGVILLFNQSNDDYIVLAKRTEDAKVNPNSHSGFFGGAEAEDKNDPKLIASRELNEELLVTTKDKKKVFYLRLDGRTKEIDIVKDSAKLWNKKLSKDEISVNIDDYHPLEPGSSRKTMLVKYIEHDGRKKIFIPTFNLEESLDELIFFDCETKDEHPRGNLLDRQIDIFRFKEFKEWWLSNNSLCLKAHLSFKSGRVVASGWIVRENKRISPSLILALNQWWINSGCDCDNNQA